MARSQTDPNGGRLPDLVSPVPQQTAGLIDLPLVPFHYAPGITTNPVTLVGGSCGARCRAVVLIVDPSADLEPAVRQALNLDGEAVALFIETTSQSTSDLMRRWPTMVGHPCPLVVLDSTAVAPLQMAAEYLQNLEQDGTTPTTLLVAGGRRCQALLGNLPGLSGQLTLAGCPDVEVRWL